MPKNMCDEKLPCEYSFHVSSFLFLLAFGVDFYIKISCSFCFRYLHQKLKEKGKTERTPDQWSFPSIMLWCLYFFHVLLQHVVYNVPPFHFFLSFRILSDFFLLPTIFKNAQVVSRKCVLDISNQFLVSELPQNHELIG